MRMIRRLASQSRSWAIGLSVLVLTGCTESRQNWPPFCQVQSLAGPGRMAGHHFVERDPWPMTTGRYDYLDYLGLDERGRVRVRTTSGDIAALGFIGGVGAGSVDVEPLRIEPGSGPWPAHDRLCIEVRSVVPDGAGGYTMTYRLTRRAADGVCQPCPGTR